MAATLHPNSSNALLAALANDGANTQISGMLNQLGDLAGAAAGSVPTAAQTAGVAVEHKGDGEGGIVSIFTLTSVAIATVDDGVNGAGGALQIYDFPLGVIQIISAKQKLTCVVDGTGLPNDVVIDIGVGSVAAASNQEALATTLQDINNKDDITFSASLSAVDQLQFSASAANLLDGSSTAKDAYLNVAATAATSDANGTLTVTGEIRIHWLNLGT